MKRTETATNSNISAKVGGRVRHLRAARGLTQQQLAENAGLSTQTLSRVERGEQGASLETLERIAAAFGEPITTLFAFDDARKAAGSASRQIRDQLPVEPLEMRQRLERILAILAGDP